VTFSALAKRLAPTSPLLLASTLVAAAPLPVGQPDQQGFSTERLARLDQFYTAAVDKGEIPGAVVLIERNGRIVYERAFGFADRSTNTRMTNDTVFWIASMTKPVTSVAAMTLVEQGRLNLEERLSTYLPELKGLKVAVESVNGKTGQHSLTLVPTVREPTVQDLLRHTSGFVYGFLGDSLVNRAYGEADVLNNKHTTAEMISGLATLPLAHQPGTTFEYSMSVDVLGRVIEVVSGEPLDRYIDKNVAGPLRLTTLKFHVDKDHQWAWSSIAAAREKSEDMRTTVHTNATLLSGGGGMYSTAEDYARFAQMLLNGGELDGVRILSPKTVALMSHNHLAPDVIVPPSMRALLADIAPSTEMGQGFGLGFAVRTDEGRNPLSGSVGDYFWAGAGGTYFWIDPQEQLVVVAMVPVASAELERKYRQYSRELVYQALVRTNLRQLGATDDSAHSATVK
jgi:CubicO group peptidase (beta-lactamase class C family)